MTRFSLALAAFVIGAGGFAPSAWAGNDTYPQRSVRVLVGYSPGGPTDMVARLLAANLQARLGQPFVVENRAGAGSNIASEAVAAAPADGYTLLVAAAPLTMNRYVYKDIKFDAVNSFAPISKLSSAPGVLAVRPGLGVDSVQDLIALARQQPGKLTYGSTGVGGSQHMATELFQSLTGTQLVHVPYKGASNALNDLSAGHIDLAFMTASGAMPYLQAGKIKPLAVAGSRRLKTLPDLPSFAELGFPAMVSDSWNGLLAPAGTDPRIIRILAEATAEAMQNPEMKQRLEDQGALVIANTPEAFAADIRQEVAQWGEQFKTIRLDAQ